MTVLVRICGPRCWTSFQSLFLDGGRSTLAVASHTVQQNNDKKKRGVAVAFCVCCLHVKHAELHSKVVAEMEHQTAGDVQEGREKALTNGCQKKKGKKFINGQISRMTF